NIYATNDSGIKPQPRYSQLMEIIYNAVKLTGLADDGTNLLAYDLSYWKSNSEEIWSIYTLKP
ncbi:MAG: hypothetical protein ACKPKO_07540, partial [Candidatus Fonsibacter sp.]